MSQKDESLVKLMIYRKLGTLALQSACRDLGFRAGKRGPVLQVLPAVCLLSIAVVTRGWSQAGSIDTNFNSDSVIQSPVQTVVVQPNGQILVGGGFRKL